MTIEITESHLAVAQEFFDFLLAPFMERTLKEKFACPEVFSKDSARIAAKHFSAEEIKDHLDLMKFSYLKVKESREDLTEGFIGIEEKVRGKLVMLCLSYEDEIQSIPRMAKDTPKFEKAMRYVEQNGKVNTLVKENINLLYQGVNMMEEEMEEGAADHIRTTLDNVSPALTQFSRYSFANFYCSYYTEPELNVLIADTLPTSKMDRALARVIENYQADQAIVCQMHLKKIDERIMPAEEQLETLFPRVIPDPTSFPKNKLEASSMDLSKEPPSLEGHS
jgi:hypothetical protein